MRQFNLKTKFGTEVAWKLTVEQAVELLHKLHDEEYLLSDYESKRTAYKVLANYRKLDAPVVDFITGERLEIHDLAEHEERLYA